MKSVLRGGGEKTEVYSKPGISGAITKSTSKPLLYRSKFVPKLLPVKTYFSTQYSTKKTPSPLRKKESPKCKVPTLPERPISTPHTSDESGDETERLAAVRRKIDVDESHFGGADPLDDLLENRRPAVKTGNPSWYMKGQDTARRNSTFGSSYRLCPSMLPQ